MKTKEQDSVLTVGSLVSANDPSVKRFNNADFPTVESPTRMILNCQDQIAEADETRRVGLERRYSSTFVLIL